MRIKPPEENEFHPATGRLGAVLLAGPSPARVPPNQLAPANAVDPPPAAAQSARISETGQPQLVCSSGEPRTRYPVNAPFESSHESRMREIRTSGSTRGRAVAVRVESSPPLYSTDEIELRILRSMSSPTG